MEPQEINFTDIAKRPSAVQVSATPSVLLDAWVALPDATGARCKLGPLIFHAIAHNDVEKFLQIMDLHNILPESNPLDLNGSTENWIIEYDRPAFLDEFIRRTGSGITITQQSQDGREEVVSAASQKKHKREYLGLNVHGKKRRDLVKMTNPDATSRETSFSTPILWRAAVAGSMEILKYLASDKPLAAFQHYAATQGNERAEYLRKVQDLSVVLPQWLGWHPNALGESSLTGAIFSNKLDVLKYLVNLQRPYLRDALTRKYVSISTSRRVHD